MTRDNFEAKPYGDNEFMVEQIKSKAGELLDLIRALKMEKHNFPMGERALFNAESNLEMAIAWALKAAARGAMPKQKGTI